MRASVQQIDNVPPRPGEFGEERDLLGDVERARLEAVQPQRPVVARPGQLGGAGQVVGSHRSHQVAQFGDSRHLVSEREVV